MLESSQSLLTSEPLNQQHALLAQLTGALMAQQESEVPCPTRIGAGQNIKQRSIKSFISHAARPPNFVFLHMIQHLDCSAIAILASVLLLLLHGLLSERVSGSQCCTRAANRTSQQGSVISWSAELQRERSCRQHWQVKKSAA